MPKKVANSQANVPTNANCVGDNVSPELSWTSVPDGTKSFVLLMVDPEGRGGAGVCHWVAYGIPASSPASPKAKPASRPTNMSAAKARMGVGYYSGPCTPPGQSPHHYTFTLIATDFEPTELPPGLTHDEVTAKLAPPGQPPAHTKGVDGSDRLVRQSLAPVIGIVVERRESSKIVALDDAEILARTMDVALRHSIGATKSIATSPSCRATRRAFGMAACCC